MMSLYFQIRLSTAVGPKFISTYMIQTHEPLDDEIEYGYWDTCMKLLVERTPSSSSDHFKLCAHSDDCMDTQTILQLEKSRI